MKKHLNVEATEAELYRFFGEPLRLTLAHYAPNQVEELLETYRAFNMENHDNLTTIFPGVLETLEELKQRDIKMGIVTSKLRNGALKGVKLAGFEKYIQTLVALEDTEKHKPNPEPILKALSALDEKPNNSIMVGDSPFDWRCARNANCTSVAVTWSVHPMELIQAEKPNFIIDNINQLLEII